VGGIVQCDSGRRECVFSIVASIVLTIVLNVLLRSCA
jgi:hypothetical protein